MQQRLTVAPAVPRGADQEVVKTVRIHVGHSQGVAEVAEQLVGVRGQIYIYIYSIKPMYNTYFMPMYEVLYLCFLLYLCIIEYIGKYFLNLVELNQIWIMIYTFPMIWHQTKFRLVIDQLKSVIAIQIW